MNSAKNIRELFKRLSVNPDADMDRKVDDGITRALEEWEKSTSAVTLPSMRRTIMKSRITKLAAAAVIIVALALGTYILVGDGAGAAWADVAASTAQVNFVHVYILRFGDDGLKDSGQAWYGHGKKLVSRFGGSTTFDDGQVQRVFDRHKTLILKQPSQFTKGRTVLNLAGLLTEDNKQFSQELPDQVGDDFLIYVLDAPKHQRDWIESLAVTVGRKSLLPVQIKARHKKQPGAFATYDLLIFDYEEPKKPVEFFEPPTVSGSPHGKGEVVLDGEQVTIDIDDAEGIKAAVVRLYGKSFDDTSELALLVDVAFIIEEGFKSNTLSTQLKLNQGKKCGVGADNWPDGKSRNITFTPLLKPTDREDTYVVEISCWLRTEED
ncbi:MAG: hypothetical protein ACYTEX_06180 [Planctomycetota bacterium]|jgi:hypothetical protein